MMPAAPTASAFRRGFLPGLVLAAVALGGCVPPTWERPSPPPVTVKPSPVEPSPSAPRLPPQPTAQLPRSLQGNPPFYEVFGERYHVLPDSAGYQAKGKASWYGRQFHGKPTSSGQIYDMHDFTAAHKTLPLPTLVRVTNLANGKSVLVTVNDRGPFVANRIIDLSYAAATELDMVKAGTADVEVEAVSVSVAANSGSPPDLARKGGPLSTVPTSTALPPSALYLQVGAFGDQVNAERMKNRLAAGGVSNVVIRYDAASGAGMYRVRIGPLAGADEYDAMAARVRKLAITDSPQLVTESPPPVSAVGD